MEASALAEINLADQIAETYYNPLDFVLLAYPWGMAGTDLAQHDGPDVWQRDQLLSVAERLDKNPRATIYDSTRSGHGIGKSAQVSWLCQWAMSTRPHLNGVVTANTADQLKNKTWRELAVWHKLLINKHWFQWTATKYHHVDHPETWFVSAVPNNPSNAESFAGQHAKHVIIVYDEGSSIEDIIWETSEGAMTTPGAMWFAFGNPTRNTGMFRETHGSLGHRWIHRAVDSRTSKLTEHDLIKQWAEDYGDDSDFFRVRVKGEFPRASDSQFIPQDIVEAAQERELDPRVWAHSPKFLGVDVAKGGGAGDRSVIIRRQGPKSWKPRSWRNRNPAELAGYVVDEYNDWRPQAVMVDGSSIGNEVVRILQEQGLPVIDVLVGNPAVDKIHWANLRAEIWGRMAEWLGGEVDIPVGKDFRDQLIGIEYGHDKQMRIQLEAKKDMVARNLESPDEADALALTFVDYTAVRRSRPVRKVTNRYPGAWA